jgi:hypothetical protein
LAEARTARNRRHLLVGLLRQSVFGRLAGYEDVNDADRLCGDPAMRWVVGGKAPMDRATSASQMGRFETEWLAAPENLAALADLPGQWIDAVHKHVSRGSSCSVWIRAKARLTAHRKAAPAMGISAAPATSAVRSLAHLERCALRSGSVTAPPAGEKYWSR